MPHDALQRDRGPGFAGPQAVGLRYRPHRGADAYFGRFLEREFRLKRALNIGILINIVFGRHRHIIVQKKVENMFDKTPISLEYLM